MHACEVSGFGWSTRLQVVRSVCFAVRGNSKPKQNLVHVRFNMSLPSMQNYDPQGLTIHRKSPVKLMELVEFLNTHNIEEAYDFLRYDNSKELKHKHGEDYAAERAAFVQQFQWLLPPSSEYIRRIFNQLNTHYAEDWAFNNLNVNPVDLLIEANRLVLYKQGKATGLRSRNIAFGVRKNLDFLDPRRQFKWLRGIAPKFIAEAIMEWSRTIESVQPNFNTVLFLTMALIAIHPFPDGNGRVARIVFTWLTKRWGIEEQWLAEDRDGEFLRTGEGLHSTENYMGMFLLVLCGGFNRKEYGFHERHTSKDEEQAFLTIQSHFRAVVKGENSMFNEDNFRSLKAHLEDNNHFRLESPRFESLRTVIA
jgi:hypothetical protein